jgi:hypothetical protein
MLGLARQLFGLARRFSGKMNHFEIFDSDLNLNAVSATKAEDFCRIGGVPYDARPIG